MGECHSKKQALSVQSRRESVAMDDWIVGCRGSIHEDSKDVIVGNIGGESVGKMLIKICGDERMLMR